MNIRLFWGTWDQYASESIKNSNLFENYVDIGNINKFYSWAQDKEYTPKDLSARDIGHCGIPYHKYWAELFHEAYLNNLSN